MCGRFALASLEKEIIEEFDVKPFTYIPSYNIAPTHNIFVIKEVGKISLMRWGLIPSWSKDEKVAYSMINARAETLEEKPAFKKPFLTMRCLILSSGFYEWKKSSNEKIPFYIYVKTKKPFSLAGIYDIWEKDGKRIESCAIITTQANSFMWDIHDRMPVIIGKKDREKWLAMRIKHYLFLMKKN